MVGIRESYQYIAFFLNKTLALVLSDGAPLDAWQC